MPQGIIREFGGSYYICPWANDCRRHNLERECIKCTSLVEVRPLVPLGTLQTVGKPVPIVAISGDTQVFRAWLGKDHFTAEQYPGEAR